MHSLSLGTDFAVPKPGSLLVIKTAGLLCPNSCSTVYGVTKTTYTLLIPPELGNSLLQHTGIMMWHGKIGNWNTCCKHKMAVAFINPSLDPQITVYCSYMYLCRELSERVLLQTFQEDSTWLNRLRGKQWSVIQRTSKYVTVTLDTDDKRINVPCIQTYRWKVKLAVLMLPRFQGSLQRTKTFILKPGKRSTWIYRSTLRRRVC